VRILFGRMARLVCHMGPVTVTQEVRHIFGDLPGAWCDRICEQDRDARNEPPHDSNLAAVKRSCQNLTSSCDQGAKNIVCRQMPPAGSALRGFRPTPGQVFGGRNWD